MQLKVSPKYALQVIDDLIKKTRNTILTIESSYKLKESMGIQPDVYNAEYRGILDEWYPDAVQRLESLIIDYAPIDSFKFPQLGISQAIKQVGVNIHYSNILSAFISRIHVLQNFYKEISKNIKSSLCYLPDKTQIWFYDFCLQLKPETNESELCRFMFQFGIGEEKELAAIYAFLKGEDVDEIEKWGKNWSATVKSAYESLNEKTKKRFGFPIYKKEKNVLLLEFPSRFIAP